MNLFFLFSCFSSCFSSLTPVYISCNKRPKIIMQSPLVTVLFLKESFAFGFLQSTDIDPKRDFPNSRMNSPRGSILHNRRDYQHHSDTYIRQCRTF